MADAYSAGAGFRSVVEKALPYVNPVTGPQNIGSAGADAVRQPVSNFFRGLVGADPAYPTSTTVQLPPLTAKAVAPAALAAAPVAAKAAVVDPTAGLAGLSFRQLLSLGQLGQTEQRATPKPITAVDQAGNQLASIYQGQFANSLKAAGDDVGKKQAAIDAFEKKMLPIALKGNTADAAIFDGPTPGAQ